VLKSVRDREEVWADVIVDELVRSGATCFFLAAGTLHARLAFSLRRRTDVDVLWFIDERAAAFAALGYGQAVGHPGVVITTQGPPLGNMTPAVIEASTANIPLIAITADGPVTDMDLGLPRYVDQRRFFGEFARYFYDMPLKDFHEAPPIAQLVNYVVQRSMRVPRGPCHLNVRFSGFQRNAQDLVDWSDELQQSTIRDCVRCSSHVTQHALPTRATMKAIAERIASVDRGVLLLGHLPVWYERHWVATLIDRLKWTVFADVLSGFRLGFTHPSVCQQYPILYDPTFMQARGTFNAFRPEMILQLGDPVVNPLKWSNLNVSKDAEYLLIACHPNPRRPHAGRITTVEASEDAFCAALLELLPERRAPSGYGFENETHHFSRFLRQYTQTELDHVTVAYCISQSIPPHHALFLASSLSVYVFGAVAATTGCSVPVGANRGACGIDGTIATACGFAKGLGRPVTAIVGDLAAIYDLNSLELFHAIPQPSILLVLNNGGGGMSSHVDRSYAEGSKYRPLLTVPRRYDFDHAAKMFHLAYERVATPSQLEFVYEKAVRCNHSTLIEVEMQSVACGVTGSRFRLKLSEFYGISKDARFSATVVR
jgi:2-succinyl-5-enolpyruvyl-6-hydroxy-3-cyclohexene-1-carboxylate synthase